MRTALRDINHITFVGRQNNRNVVLKRGRIKPEVNDDVEYRTARATYQFCLRMRRNLVMHAAQRALSCVEGNATLHEFRVQPVSPELAHAPGAREKAALVWFGLELNVENSWNLGFSEYHAAKSSLKRTAVIQVLSISKIHY